MGASVQHMALVAADASSSSIFKVPLDDDGVLVFKSAGFLEPHCKLPNNFIVLSAHDEKDRSPKSDAGSSQWNVDSGPTSRSGSTPRDSSGSDATPNSITEELTKVPNPREIRQLLLSQSPSASAADSQSSSQRNGESSPAATRIIGPQLPTPEELKRAEQKKIVTTVARKRCLSERGEQEAQFPTLDNRISTNGWKDFLSVQQRKCGTGLHNPSNDCFMNAVLQAVVHTPQLARFIVQQHKKECTSQFNCLMCALREHCIRSFVNDVAQSSRWMYRFLQKIFPHHRIGHQEDAHELLTLLLGALDPLPPKSPNGTNGNLKVNGPKPSTPIEQIFGGTLRNQVRCQDCKTVHTNYERIREINLGLSMRAREGRPSSISELVSDFFSQEQIQQFACKNCKRKVSATRTTTVLRAPMVLIVQLKRFNSFGGKNKLPVNAEEYLKLQKYLFDHSDTVYRLYGVIEHLGGGLNFGHYVAAMRGFNEQTWYHFDDDHRQPVTLQRVQSMQPYILFYTRVQSNGVAPPSPQKVSVLNGSPQKASSSLNGTFQRSQAGNGSMLGKRPFSGTSVFNGLQQKTSSSPSTSSSAYYGKNVNSMSGLQKISYYYESKKQPRLN